MDHLRLWQEGGGLDLYFTRKGVEYQGGVDMLNWNDLQKPCSYNQLGMVNEFQPFSKPIEMKQLQQFKNKIEKYQNS